MNENSMDGKLAKSLKQIGLVEAFCRKFKGAGLPSYAIGRDQTDSLWTSSGMIPTNIELLLHRFGTCDHRVKLIDFNLSNVAGHVMRTHIPGMRITMCENKPVVEKYNKEVLELLKFHNIEEKLNKLREHWDVAKET